MMRLRFLVPFVGLASLSIFAACGSSDEKQVAQTGGAGGEPAGEPAGGAGGACTSDATGTLVLEVSGLPDGVMPDVSIAGPEMFDATDAGALEKVKSGDYTVTVNRVFDADPIVRTVFDGTVTTPDVTLCDGSSQTIKVTYTAIPSSNKLWMPTALDDELAGFASAQLGASATKTAAVAIDGPGSGAVAFDKDGNLWALGPTVADKMVARFPAAKLGTSGTVKPDISFDLPEIACSVALKSLAFDADGNLWLSSTCGGEVYRVPAADLTTSGDKVADVVITSLFDTDGAGDNEGLAFDHDGNLWIGGGVALRRFDATRLGDSTSDPADLELSVKDSLAALVGNNLAFDKAGNLWATDFAANAVFEVAAAELDQTGSKNSVAERSITIGIMALLSQPAFDDGNGLWLGLDVGRIGRLSPAQLGVNSTAAEPTTPAVIIKSGSIDTELPIAFFPAPAGLPLYHSIPAP
ncbi:MAG TPA: hypothetical protein VNG33_24350 [Polyangiaceae bacterium]|nr:hypothetical protein [Polyangiaceae bacterium]